MGNVNLSSVTNIASTSDPYTFADDVKLSLGTGGTAAIQYQTDDANANCLAIILPAGGATDVPVIVIGDTSVEKDLTLFNGVTDPQIAIMSSDEAVNLRLIASAPPTIMGSSYLRIGDAGTTSHTLNTNDDLLVSGNFECDGLAYFDSTITIANAYYFQGPGVDSEYYYFKAKDNAVGEVHIMRMTGGVDPFVLLGRDDSGCSTNSITTMCKLQGGCGATNEAAGFGVRFDWLLGNAASQVESRACIDAVLATATDGSEDANFVFNLMDGGVAPAAVLTLTGADKSATFAGNITLPSGGTVISAGSIILQPSGDSSDYITIATVSDVPSIYATGSYLRIGDAAATSHTLDSEDDLMVSGELEVDGATFLDGTLAATGAVTCASTVTATGVLTASNLRYYTGSFTAGAAGNAVMAWQNPTTAGMMMTARTYISTGGVATSTGDMGLATTVAVLEDCEDVWNEEHPSTCTLTQTTGTLTESGVALNTGANELHITGAGTFTFALPSGYTATVANGTATVTPTGAVSDTLVIDSGITTGTITVTVTSVCSNAVNTTYTERGTNCIAFTTTADTDNGDLIATEAITLTDISTATHILMKVRVATSVAASDLALSIDETAGCASPSFTLNLPAIASGSTQLVCLAINGGAAAGATCDAIISIGLEYNANAAANTIYLDDIRAITVGADFFNNLALDAAGIGNAATPIYVGPKATTGSSDDLDCIVMVSATAATTNIVGKYYFTGQEV